MVLAFAGLAVTTLGLIVGIVQLRGLRREVRVATDTAQAAKRAAARTLGTVALERLHEIERDLHRSSAQADGPGCRAALVRWRRAVSEATGYVKQAGVSGGPFLAAANASLVIANDGIGQLRGASDVPTATAAPIRAIGQVTALAAELSATIMLTTLGEAR